MGKTRVSRFCVYILSHQLKKCIFGSFLDGFLFDESQQGKEPIQSLDAVGQPRFVTLEHFFSVNWITRIMLSFRYCTEFGFDIRLCSPEPDVMVVRWQRLFCDFLVAESFKLRNRSRMVVPKAAITTPGELSLLCIVRNQISCMWVTRQDDPECMYATKSVWAGNSILYRWSIAETMSPGLGR